MGKARAIVLSIMAVSVPLYIFLLTQICKSCVSLKKAFLWDDFIDRNTQEAFKVCRGCGHKVMGGIQMRKVMLFGLAGAIRLTQAGVLEIAVAEALRARAGYCVIRPWR